MQAYITLSPLQSSQLVVVCLLVMIVLLALPFSLKMCDNAKESDDISNILTFVIG